MAETTRAVFSVHIRGTIDAVWREITKTDEPQGAMFNMCLDTKGLAPGEKIFMRTPNGKFTGVVGEVLEFDPPHKYSHTFKFTNYDDPPCKVTYELTEKDGGVEFKLIVDDMPVGTKTAKDMTGGGKMIVNTLKAIVETGRPPMFTRGLYRMFALLGPLMTPKRCRSENWR
ncbi:MAG: SRPBCC domain-containing protein [Phycisphaerales bacterium]|nr:SRPBCC domain-containing protein [Phycisphaerales bacterium]